ncbi:hypothetical protein THAOC_37333, partial [Thalassiosira oceanica]
MSAPQPGPRPGPRHHSRQIQIPSSNPPVSSSKASTTSFSAYSLSKETPKYYSGRRQSSLYPPKAPRGEDIPKSHNMSCLVRPDSCDCDDFWKISRLNIPSDRQCVALHSKNTSVQMVFAQQPKNTALPSWKSVQPHILWHLSEDVTILPLAMAFVGGVERFWFDLPRSAFRHALHPLYDFKSSVQMDLGD